MLGARAAGKQGKTAQHQAEQDQPPRIVDRDDPKQGVSKRPFGFCLVHDVGGSCRVGGGGDGGEQHGEHWRNPEQEQPGQDHTRGRDNDREGNDRYDLAMMPQPGTGELPAQQEAHHQQRQVGDPWEPLLL